MGKVSKAGSGEITAGPRP